MAIPASLARNLKLPVICAPMCIISNPDLVIAQCKSGVHGSDAPETAAVEIAFFFPGMNTYAGR